MASESESDSSSSDSISDPIENAVAEQTRRFLSENIHPSSSRSFIVNQYNPATAAYATSSIRAPITNNWQPSSRHAVARYNPSQPVIEPPIRLTSTPVISNIPMHWHEGQQNPLNPFDPIFKDIVADGHRIITLRLRHIGPPLYENFLVMNRLGRFITEFKKYCDKIGLIFEDQRFLIDGNAIDLRDSPATLELQHGQIIEVFRGQGGKRKRSFTSTPSKRFRSNNYYGYDE